MPRPEGAGLTQNFSPRLGRLAISYLPSNKGFIGSRVFPNVPVGAAAGEYNILPRGAWLRRQGKKLANNEAPPLGGFDFTKSTYSVDEYGVAANWTQRDLNNADVGMIGAGRLRTLKTRFVTFQAQLALEYDIQTLVRTDANWTYVKTGVAASPTTNEFLQWNDASSDPVSDIDTWKLAVFYATGFMPNRMILPMEAINALKLHPDIIDRIKYTGTGASPARVNLTTLKELFELDEILVPMAVHNTANEGATDVIVSLWGKDAFLFYAPMSPSMEEPSAGYRFSWAAADGYVGPQPFGRGLNAEGLYIANYTTDRPAAEWVESRWYTTPKVTGASLAVRIKTVVA
jgi:hypothetical protein